MSNSTYLGSLNIALNNLLENPLYKNSFYIYLNVLANAALGFFFWTLASRLYSSSDIGIASTIFSCALIISCLSSFGFPNGIIRFLPESNNKEQLFNSVSLISFLGIILFLFLFSIYISYFSPSLRILANSYTILILSLFLFFFTGDSFVYYGLLSLRRADYAFVQAIVQSMRIFLLLPMSFAGALGIFGSLAIAYIFSFSIGVIFLSKMNIKLRLIFNKNIVKNLLKFSLANYLNDILSISQTSILPIIVMSALGAKETAYFFIAFSIANLLFAIPTSIFTSTFIETSHGRPIKGTVIKAAKLVLVLLIPSSVFIYYFGYDLLSIFGREYSENAHNSLKILALSSPFVAMNCMFLSLRRILHDIKKLSAFSILLFILTIYLSYSLTMQRGICGAALGWTLGQIIAATAALAMLIYERFDSY